MGITYVNTNPIGTGGQVPLIIYINTTDDNTAVAVPGYLNQLRTQGYNFFDGQMALVNSSDGPSFWDVVVTRTGANFTYSLVFNTDGCVTAVTATTPILSSGGLTPNISLASKGIGTGTAINATVTYDDKGLITAISNGAADLTPFQVLTTNAILQVNNGYFTNSVSQLVLTAPASFVLSDEIEIANVNSGGWIINLNAGQTIRVGSQITSAGGTIASSAIGDTVRLVAWNATSLIILSGVTEDFVIT